MAYGIGPFLDFLGSTCFLSMICVCEEVFPRIYNNSMHPPKLVSKLTAPSITDDAPTSGSTSGASANESGRRDRRGQDGLFSSNIEARCKLINGTPDTRLNKKVRIRPGSKLVTLLARDELFPGGTRAKPLGSEWVSAFLRTFRRIPYIEDRDLERCQSHDCCRAGVSITLNGKTTKRRH